MSKNDSVKISMEGTLRKCNNILEILTQSAAKAPVSLLEYIRCVQYAILVIDQYISVKKDERPKVDSESLKKLEGISNDLVNQLEHLGSAENVQKFSKLLSSHRLNVRLENLFVQLYIESRLVHLLLQDVNNGRRKTKKKEKEKEEKDSGPKYPFAAEHKNFNSIISDERAQAMWVEDSFMMPWNTFIHELARSSSNIDDDDNKRLQYVLDSSKTGYVSVYRFSNFVKMFGPIRDSVEKVKSVLSSQYFHGYMGHSDTKKLLANSNVGTFFIRLSKTKPDNVIVSHITATKDVAHILMESCHEGFHTLNAHQNRTVRTLDDLFQDYKTALQRGFVCDLMKTEYFFSELSDWETEYVLQGEKVGTFIARYDPQIINSVQGFIVSYVDKENIVKHHRGLHQKANGCYQFRGHKCQFDSLDKFIEILEFAVYPLDSVSFDMYYSRRSRIDKTKNSTDKRKGLWQRRFPTTEIRIGKFQFAPTRNPGPATMMKGYQEIPILDLGIDSNQPHAQRIIVNGHKIGAYGELPVFPEDGRPTNSHAHNSGHNGRSNGSHPNYGDLPTFPANAQSGPQQMQNFGLGVPQAHSHSALHASYGELPVFPNNGQSPSFSYPQSNYKPAVSSNNTTYGELPVFTSTSPSLSQSQPIAKYSPPQILPYSSPHTLPYSPPQSTTNRPNGGPSGTYGELPVFPINGTTSPLSYSTSSIPSPNNHYKPTAAPSVNSTYGELPVFTNGTTLSPQSYGHSNSSFHSSTSSPSLSHSAYGDLPTFPQLQQRSNQISPNYGELPQLSVPSASNKNYNDLPVFENGFPIQQKPRAGSGGSPNNNLYNDETIRKQLADLAGGSPRSSIHSASPTNRKSYTNKTTPANPNYGDLPSFR